jgi:HlyD family secretion protein
VSGAPVAAPEISVPGMAPAGPLPRRRRRWRPFLLWTAGLALLAGAAGLAWALYRSPRVAVSNNLPMATARKGEFLVTVTCRGELVAERSVQITAPLNVPNLQIVWMAPQGAAVKSGELVLRFDASGAKRQLDENGAALKQAQATLDQAVAQAAITAEQDKLELATLRQAVEKARLEVSKKEIVSVLQGEEDRINLGLAEQKLKVQEAAMTLNATSAQSKIASTRSQRDKAQVEVDLSKQRIAGTEVHAPAAGVINYLMNYSQGWMNAKPFKLGDNVWPGSAVAEIPDLASLRLKGKAEEIDRGRMREGQDARVILDPFPEKPFLGKLERISVLTEQSFEWPPSRSFRAFATLGPGDDRLRPAMNGRMDVIVDRIPNAISVPAKAVFARDGRPVVLVPGREGLRAVRVEVVARNPDEVAIRGIEAGAQVALVDDLEGKGGGGAKAAAGGGSSEVRK